MTRRRFVTLRRPPRPTVRLRLTLLYGGLFLISGAALLAITYLLASEAKIFAVQTGPTGQPPLPRPKHGVPPGAVLGHAPLAPRQTVIDLHHLLLLSGAALAIMAVASIGLGWLVAGRVLRRLRIITQTAREISATNLHDRLALEGPDDELKELGSTLDELLGRLEASFTAQRQFVANASHELRTPLARQRTLIEIALGDPDATVESLQANNQRVLAAGEQQERMIDALLTLARSEAGIEDRGPLDLATITREVLTSHAAEAERRSVEIEASLSPAPCWGDPRLIGRLIANLIENAIRYNSPAGLVEVQTGLGALAESDLREAALTVRNAGPLIAAADVQRLFEPFQRLDAGRLARNDGAGLGLAIVHAIAAAHQARLTAMPQPKGGLCIEVAFAARSHARDHLVGTSEAALRRATDGTYNDAELASRLRHPSLSSSAAVSPWLS
jgi:signal transduction histidine kinase